MSGDAWAIVVGVAFFVLIVIGFIWTGRSDADQAARQVGYRSGALWQDGKPDEPDEDEPRR